MFLFSFVLIGQDWLIHCSIFNVMERDGIYYFVFNAIGNMQRKGTLLA